ncbi:MAG: DUF962 domain-containing protein [Candidatus Brachytrichaceae bacterium NZ_4S206]|jgi:hypothetical protein
MLEKLTGALTEKNRDLALVAGGMLGIMTGAKATPLAMFAVGLRGLEKHWRAAHPEFEGGMAERWQKAIEFYDETHQHPTNRVLHTVGIPMIVGGALGMLAAPRYTPPWWIANGSWTAGWVLNFIGHGVYEKGAPAFADDPLSFVAGPVWDFVRLREKLSGVLGQAAVEERAPEANGRSTEVAASA